MLDVVIRGSVKAVARKRKVIKRFGGTVRTWNLITE